MSLRLYHAKRNFEQTPEPVGKIAPSPKKLSFVVQKHAASHLHYDFRLEMQGVLKSWAVPKGPSLDPAVKRLAIEVEDHPLEYGKFEGIIPKKQYGAGVVMLWDKGNYQLSHNNPVNAYQKGDLTFTLKGKKLKGIWKLIRIKNRPKQWLLIKVQDTYAQPIEKVDITASASKSILTHRTLEEIEADHNKLTAAHKKELNAIKKEKLPARVYPELATLVDKVPTGNEWLHEVKFDGYRLVCFIKQGTITLLTRNQQDWTKKLPLLIKELNALSIDQAILDGELVALNEKHQPNFQLLQNLIHRADTSTLIYYVFDLLYYDYHDLTKLPLIERKAKLHQLIPTSDSTVVKVNDYVIGQGKTVYKKACQFRLEGIISKSVQSTYIQKRTRDWLKVKCVKQQEFVVGGFTRPQGKREYFGSLLLGVYVSGNRLQYCGRVGTGFTQESLETLWRLLKKYQTPLNPFMNKPALANVFWVKPHLVIEVAFSEWTREGLLRHPSFKGVRSDKSYKEVTREKTTDES
jgi:bifunctional non-homologous end joining protein LigD